MTGRTDRIIETAVELAEKGGFEAVRLREVAANAGVALGTLYRHFRSKEDLLMAALTRETQALAEYATRNPPDGDTPLERVTSYFTLATRMLCHKPKFARAVLRSAASGEPELTEKLEHFNLVLGRLVVAALHGKRPERSEPDGHELEIAEVLHAVWFAALLGWMSGQHGQIDVVDRVQKAARLMILSAPPEF